MDNSETLKTSKKSYKKYAWILLILILSVIAITAYFYWRFTHDEAVEYTQIEEHFKYGSTGGERNLGFPYWIWQALPKVCADYLPGEGYESVGMIYEDGKDLPVGVSKRRAMGLDLVFLNCAACHTSTLRTRPDSKPAVISGMPANLFNLRGFQDFFFNCAADARFTKGWIIPEIDRQGADLDLVDRYITYPVAIWIMRERVLSLKQRFKFVDQQPEWGPGRVDTFNAAKVIFNFPLDKAPIHEKLGTSDFSSIWLQRQRQGMQLHWDGNNDKVEERNRSAAFGTGATPAILERENVKRIEDWLLDLKPPEYPFPINLSLAEKGKPVYEKYCASCHGKNGRDFSGEYVGTVVPIDQIKTDRWRLDSYTRKLAVNQNLLYAGYGDERFSHFRKTNGYANMPLDGIWLRAPYLHNGSVPTLAHLLEPRQRPTIFYRGNDLYDQVKVGFVSEMPAENGKTYFRFDTRLAGNSNHGHEGKTYGTELSPDKKRALLEYLKTF